MAERLIYWPRFGGAIFALLVGLRDGTLNPRSDKKFIVVKFVTLIMSIRAAIAHALRKFLATMDHFGLVNLGFPDSPDEAIPQRAFVH